LENPFILFVLLSIVSAVLFCFILAKHSIIAGNRDSAKTRLGFGARGFNFLWNEPGELAVTILFFGVLAFGIIGAIVYTFSFTYFIHLTGNVFLSFLIHLLGFLFLLLLTFSLVPLLVQRIRSGLLNNIIFLLSGMVYIFIMPLIKIFYGLSVLLANVLQRGKPGLKNADLNYNCCDISNISGISFDHAEQDTEMEHDIKIFQNALDFSELKLRDCAIPRNEIETVELNSPVENLREKFIQTGYSKILIYKDTIDNIIGYAQSVDMFRLPKNLSSIVKNLMIVPETMPASKLLNLFLKEHKSIALVVDEYGGTYGMVTIEDIIEEIIGDIEDEYDSYDLKEEEISESEFLLSGRLEIDYLNEKYGFGIPESDVYATIAGYILHNNEEIPREKDIIQIGQFEFEIVQVQGPKIELVKLKKG
jgi:CBS domain containing-hemolysin-like protein